METINVKDCPREKPELLLAGMLLYICKYSMISHWYRIWDRDEDNPPPEVRQIMDADKLGNILQLNKLSLQFLTEHYYSKTRWLLF